MLSDVKKASISGMSPENDAAMPELMRGTDEIEFAREEPFRESRDVENDTQGIHRVR